MRALFSVKVRKQARHFTLLFQVKTENPTSSLLPTDLSFSFFSVSIKPMTTMLVFSRCVCVHVECLCMCVCARMCVCACVCICVACVRYEMCFSASVRALGSHEMGHHKLPIIIIILIDQQNQMCKR